MALPARRDGAAQRGEHLMPERAYTLARYHLFVPARYRAGRLIVLVHGIASEPAEQLAALVPRAARHRIPLLAPEFPRPEFHGYQRLGGSAGGLAAAHLADAAVDDAAKRLGTPPEKIDLVGFSGGAQFVHRYAMLFPERVRRLVVAAAGWYTYLDPAEPFPKGAAPSEASGGRAVDIESFLRIPLCVVAGAKDVARDPHLRADRRINRDQGAHRLERALRWVDHLSAAARERGISPSASFVMLPQTGHSFQEAVRRGRFDRRVFEFLEDDREPLAIGTSAEDRLA